MYAIKDRVYDKLSRFFSDSQLTEKTTDQQSVARPYARGEKLQTSALSFLPSASVDWYRSNMHTDEVKSHGTYSFQWSSKSYSWKDESVEKHAEGDSGVETRGSIRLHNKNGGSDDFRSPSNHLDVLPIHSENGEPGSGTSTSCSSDVFEDAPTPHTPEMSIPSPLEESLFISPNLYQFFEASLPNIVKGRQWVLLYSTVKDGISLRTLFRKSSDLTGPCLLITGDKRGAIFGGLLDCPLIPNAKRKYQGTHQTFVFTTLYGEPRIFRPTGANRYFYLCLNESLALGGGGKFALWLSEDLLHGTSGPCETFGNLCLAHDQEFELKNVELWGFAHASHYHLA